MTDGLSFPTSLGTSSADQIRLLGQDLTADLMGKVSFGELAFWLVTLRRPTPSETRVFEAVLVALADHGFTPTAIAARLTYLSAPDSLQGAMAAGLLPVSRGDRGLRDLPARGAGRAERDAAGY
jgi:citrate synthase